MSTTDDPKDQDSKRQKAQDKAILGGETVEPRILLSASWVAGALAQPADIVGTPGDDSIGGGNADETIHGLAGNDVIAGNGGDDTVIAGAGDDHIFATYGNDTIVGGAGNDTVDYSLASGSVTVDLTDTNAQDTGGGGVDRLDGVEGVVGSNYDDTFGFSNAADGEVYTVAGGTGSDTLDLTRFASAATTFTNGSLTIDLGAGESFRIDYSAVESITFADVTATVLTSDLNLPSFTGSGIFIDGGQAFRMDVTGAGTVDWQYAVGTDTLAVTDTNTTDSSTGIAITDLSGADLKVGTLSFDRDVGNVTSNVDIDTIEVTSNRTTVSSISIDGGNGTLNTFRMTGTTIIASTAIDAQVGTVDINRLNAALIVTGDIGTLTMGQLDVSGAIQAQGDVGLLTMGDVLGTFDITGNTGTLSAAFVGNSMTVGGDLDRAMFASVNRGATITATNVLGTLDFQVAGVQHGGTYLSATTYVFDGATQAATATPLDSPPIANAGANSAFSEGNIATLDGTASTDPDGKPLTYSWRQISGPTVSLVNSTNAIAGFVVPEGLTNTVARFELTVNDGANSSVDTVDVLLRADNDAPTANAGSDLTVDEGTWVALSGAGSIDPEGQALTYTWEQISGPPVTLQTVSVTPTPAPGISSPIALSPATLSADGRVGFVAPEGITNSQATFRLTVSDGTNISVDTVTVTINADDDAPTVDAGKNQLVAAKQAVTLSAVAQDPENGALVYRWTQVAGPAVQLTGDTTANPTFVSPTGYAGQAMVFAVAVSDGTSTVVDTVAVGIHNTPPQVFAGSSGSATSGEPVMLGASASDIDGDQLTYNWTQVSGPTVSIGASNQHQAFFQAPDVATSTQLTFQVEVHDGLATSTRLVVVTVDPDPNGTPGGGTTPPPPPPPQPVDPTPQPPAPTPPPTTPDPTASEPEQLIETTYENRSGTGVDEDLQAFRDSVAARSTADRGDVDTDEPQSDDEQDDERATDPADEVPTLGEEAVVAAAGSEVNFTALLAATDASEFQWRQVAGVQVQIIDGSSSALRFQLPESFSAEELVFEVEMMIDGQIVVQEVTIQVEPVEGETKDGAAAQKPESGLTEVPQVAFEEQRGVGKIWASLVAFTSPVQGPRRPTRS